MTPEPDRRKQRSAEAEEAFDEYMRRADEGEQPDFDAFCAERPELEDELRSLEADWRRMARVVDALGTGFADDVEDEAQGRTVDEPPPDADDDAAGGATVQIDVDSSSADGEAPTTTSIDSLMVRLGDERHLADRFSLRGEIARGGMGIIQRVWDGNLRRNLAMKVLRDKPADESSGAESGRQRQLGRFLEEAQITGQLEHPSIVPVHELGVSAHGKPFFTMPLVRGRSLREVFELVHEERDDWTVPRALGVLLKVCEAMAYAHSKGVLHRDLKPANVMVGRFGEVYVMDWGLAKVLGKEDLHDVRPRRSSMDTLTQVHSDRRDSSKLQPDSPLMTMDGAVVGTPAYMPPEQAKGQVEFIGPAADVYAVGAMLYHLLAGQMPYVEPGERVSPYTVLNAVREGPPRPIYQLNPRVAPELVAICDKAMARKVGERYPSMSAMADELRAFLEGRVVPSYETGAIAQLRKWIWRHKGMSATLIAALVILAFLGADLVRINRDLAATTEQALEKEREAVEARDDLAASHDELRSALTAKDQAVLDARQSASDAQWRGYLANVAAADASLRFHELGEARRQLAGCPVELRGWEWHHLMLRADPSLATRTHHTERVTAVDFAPDGSLLATGSWDSTVRVWSVDTLEPIHEIDAGERGVTAVAFHPEGTSLACAGFDGVVTRWDAVEGTPIGVLRRDLSRTTATITSLAFDPEGDRLYAGADDRRLWSWTLADGSRSSLPPLHTGPITDVAVSPDGTLLVTGSEDRTAALWDALLGEFLLFLYDHTDAVRAVSHSPTDERVATACDDGLARVFDTASGELVLRIAGHDGPIQAVSYLADGATLVTAGADHTLRLWDAYTGQARGVLTGHTDGVTCAAFSPDGARLASGSVDHSLRLWDTAYVGATTKLAGHGDRVSSLAVSPDSRRLVSGAWDARVQLWETDSLLALGMREPETEGAPAVAFSGAGDRVAAAYSAVGRAGSFPIHLWAVVDGELGGDAMMLAGHGESVRALAFDPEGELLASASDDRSVRLWHVRDGSLVHAWREHAGRAHALAFHPDRPWLASGSADETVRIQDITTGESLAVIEGTPGSVAALAWDTRGRRLVVARNHRRDATLELLDGTSFRPLGSLRGHEDAILAIAPHPDGRRLASSSADGTIRLWHLEAETALLTLRPGGPSDALAFDPEGGRLFAALDRHILVYETEPPSMHFELRHGRAALAARARAAFLERLDEYHDPREVVLRLEQDRSLDVAVREEALRLARNFGANPERMAATAWDVLTDRNAGLTAYRSALRLARAADAMRPNKARLVHVLGVALYRAGEVRLGLSQLERARDLNARMREYPTTWDLLFLAMANQRLGWRNLASSLLDEAVSERQSGAGEDDEFGAALEVEARELVRGRE